MKVIDIRPCEFYEDCNGCPYYTPDGCNWKPLPNSDLVIAKSGEVEIKISR